MNSPLGFTEDVHKALTRGEVQGLKTVKLPKEMWIELQGVLGSIVSPLRDQISTMLPAGTMTSLSEYRIFVADLMKQIDLGEPSGSSDQFSCALQHCKRSVFTHLDGLTSELPPQEIQGSRDVLDALQYAVLGILVRRSELTKIERTHLRKLFEDIFTRLDAQSLHNGTNPKKEQEFFQDYAIKYVESLISMETNPVFKECLGEFKEVFNKLVPKTAATPFQAEAPVKAPKPPKGNMNPPVKSQPKELVSDHSRVCRSIKKQMTAVVASWRVKMHDMEIKSVQKREITKLCNGLRSRINSFFDERTHVATSDIKSLRKAVDELIEEYLPSLPSVSSQLPDLKSDLYKHLDELASRTLGSGTTSETSTAESLLPDDAERILRSVMTYLVRQLLPVAFVALEKTVLRHEVVSREKLATISTAIVDLNERLNFALQKSVNQPVGEISNCLIQEIDLLRSELDEKCTNPDFLKVFDDAVLTSFRHVLSSGRFGTLESYLHLASSPEDFSTLRISLNELQQRFLSGKMLSVELHEAYPLSEDEKVQLNTSYRTSLRVKKRDKLALRMPMK